MGVLQGFVGSPIQQKRLGNRVDIVRDAEESSLLCYLGGQNRQSLAILDRGLKSQPFSQFCCIGVFKTNRQSRVSNRNFKSQERQRFESRVTESLAILDLDRAISPI